VLQCGLNYFDSVFYIPLYTCFYVLGGVLSGVNLFGDADDMGLVSILVFSAGLLLSLGGTACLARRSEVNSGRITPRLQRFLDRMESCWGGGRDGKARCSSCCGGGDRHSDRHGGGGGGGKGGGGKGGGDDGDESGAPLVDNDHYDHYSSMGSSEESRILL